MLSTVTESPCDLRELSGQRRWAVGERLAILRFCGRTSAGRPCGENAVRGLFCERVHRRHGAGAAVSGACRAGGAMSRRVANVTLDNLDDLPVRCRKCVFWELDPVSRSRAE